MSKRYTKDEFMELADGVHNNKYDYSISDFKFMKNKVSIICPEHGIFEQRPIDHVRGQGCPKCRYSKAASKRKSNFILDDFIKKANEIHNNKYDYSKFVYTGCNRLSIIICPIHGEFQQTPTRHLCSGCYKCGKNSMAEKISLSLDSFLNKARSIHGDYYEYSNVFFSRANDIISIICPKHGEFKQRLSDHLKGCGCPQCNLSKGELAIKSYLDVKCIDYIQQYWFDDCRCKNPLKFDFYLPNLNICIEFDGVQHFKSIKRFGGLEALNEIQMRDGIKNSYCELNNIKLIRIPYTRLSKVNEILERELVFDE